MLQAIEAFRAATDKLVAAALADHADGEVLKGALDLGLATYRLTFSQATGELEVYMTSDWPGKQRLDALVARAVVDVGDRKQDG